MLPQLAEVRCGVASCDVHAESILVVTCDVHACGAFSGLRSVTTILQIFGNNERTDNRNLLSFGVSYYFVAQKWRILEIFHTQKKQFWEINWKVSRFKTMFKTKILN